MESLKAKELKIFEEGFDLGVETTIEALSLAREQYLQEATHSHLIKTIIAGVFTAIIKGAQEGLLKCPHSTN